MIKDRTTGDEIDRLRRQLDEHFTESELIDLCDDLDINSWDLPGITKEDKIRELIRWCDRHEQFPALIERCRQLRPGVEWPDLVKPSDLTTLPRRLPTLIIISLLALISVILAYALLFG